MSEVGDWFWHVHHDILLERLIEPEEVRRTYIRENKPEREVATRLRLMAPVLGKVVPPVYWQKADAKRREAYAKWREADAKWREAYAKRWEADAKRREADAKRREADAKRWEAVAKRREADAKWGEAVAKWQEAKAKLGEAYAEWAAIEELHRAECPNCPWNGETIFPEPEP